MELKQLTSSLSMWLVIILGILFMYVTYVKRKFQYWKQRGISSPVEGIWSCLLLMYELSRKSVHLIQMKQYKKYGRVFGTYMGFKPHISISDPDILKRIFVKDFNIFHNRMKIEFGDPLFDKMLSILQGEDWKRVRCIMSPTFSSGRMRKMTCLVKECAEKFTEHLKKIADESKSRSVDCKKFLSSFSIDVIASTTFGTKLCSLEDPNNEFVTMARKATNSDVPFYFQLLFIFPKLMKLMGINIFGETLIFFKNFALHVIDQREKEKTKHNDFLQLLLDAQKGILEISPEDAKEDYEKDFKILPKHKTMSKGEMLSQCAMILFGGSETTTNTLAFALYYLALNPEFQDKLIQEVDDTWKNNENMDFDVLSKMTYLDAVVNETLRIEPVALQLMRTCCEEYEIPELGIRMPKGMIVLVPIYAMHHDIEFFPNPEKFDPERFMPENRHSIPQYAYLPFGEGPRNCIGMRFAVMVLKMCLVYIFRYLRVEATEETKLPLEFFRGQGFLQPRKIMVKLDRRN